MVAQETEKEIFQRTCWKVEMELFSGHFLRTDKRQKLLVSVSGVECVFLWKGQLCEFWRYKAAVFIVETGSHVAKLALNLLCS